MNQIQTIDICPTLLDEEREIITAAIRKENRIMNLTKKVISTSLTDIITKALSDSGQSKSDLNLTVFVSSFADELKSDFKNLTIQEVGIAFKNGIRGKYGEYFGINNKSAYQFCEAYYRGETKKLAMEKQLKYMEEKNKEPEMSEGLQFDLYRRSAIKKFEDFKKTSTFLDAGNVTYKFLSHALGLINHTPERREHFKVQAQEILTRQQQVKKVNGGVKADIEKALEEIENKESTVVITEAKNIALRSYFVDLIDMDMSLEDEINRAFNELK